MLLVYNLAHYFYPSHTNNHKAKLLHASSIFLIVFALIFYQVLLQVLPVTGVRILGYAANIPPSEVINLTNQKRIEAGLSALEYSPVLEMAARAKGEHMLAGNYWAHTAPDGTEPWTFFLDSGYKYRYAGENLARDFSNPASAIEAWMASPSHKENMLSSKYKEIGVAVVEGDLDGVETTIIVQLFGTRLADAQDQIPIARAEIPSSPTPTPAPEATISPTPRLEERLTTTSGPPQSEPGDFEILISPFDTTRSVSLATIVLLSAVMVTDAIVVHKRKITRVSGRTLAHIAFLGMILALLLIARAGKIL